MTTSTYEIDPSTRSPVEVRNLQRRFGTKVALDGVTFSVRPGAVTGFLGPNGAGKTTAIRVLLGLDTANAGEARVFGVPFSQLADPARRVGGVIDGAGFHPGRTARNHLRSLAAINRIGRERIVEVLDLVGLTGDADRRVGGYSLGMRRRLSLASALLAEPELLVLDEPANGLDPAGIKWLREMLRAFAASGGTVLVSSHVLAEVAQTADDVIVINHGRVVTETSVNVLTAGASVIVGSPRAPELARVLRTAGAAVRALANGTMEVGGLTPADVGVVAATRGIPLTELTARRQTLEDVFFSLTTEGGSNAA